jgi:type IV pilus assembly protein PilB
MLGEIRDKETAEMAVHAALTGHVVLSTLHTNNAAGAIPRLIDMGVEPFLLTSSINVIIGQRLCRTICTDCKEEAKVTEEEIKTIRAEIDKMPAKEKEEVKKKQFKFYKGKGCKSCDESGYQGRIGIYEVLDVTEPIKDLTLKRVSASQIEAKGIEEGMLTMTQDGIKKALEGKTSMEEVWRVTKE